MTVWDVIMYWREVAFVEARRRLWAELAPDVSYQPVLCLGDRTFRGGPIVNTLPDDTDRIITALTADDPWPREWQQRDGVTRVPILPDELVLMTDADEFVDPRRLPAILEATRSGPVKLGMSMWYFGTRWRNPEGWRHPAAFLRRDMPHRPSSLRDEHEEYPLVADAGWHLSYFNPRDTDSKLSAFSHAEHDTPEQRSLLRRGRIHGIGPNGEVLVDDPLAGPLAGLL